MAAKREPLDRDLDAAGHAVAGLPHAATADAAVRKDDMEAGDAASVATSAGAIAAEAAARAAADLLIPGTITALTGDGTASGTGSVAFALTNIPQAVLLARLAALTTDVSLNTHKLTNLLTATNPADGVPLAQVQALDTAAIVVSEGFATAADAALLASIRQPKRGEYWVYCLDYDGTGNDTTGAPGIATTMAAALAAATATPFKTYERVAQLRPSNGGGATLVELAKPRAAGAPYRNMANSADQDGSWLSWLSNWHFLSRGSLDFANDTNDKIRAGFLTLAGTNGAGYKVTASSNANGSTTLTCVLAGGGAPGFAAESGGFSAITGLRIRGLATNPTAALQNFCVGIQKNTGTTLGTMATLPAVPLPPTDPSGGDVFVIETPGVTVGNLTHFAGYNRTFCLVGFNATATSALNHQTPTSRITGCNLTTASFSDGEIYAALTSYVDEADANITVGYGFKCSTGVSFNSTKAVTVFASSWLGATQMSVGTTVLSSSIGGGCVSVQGLRNNATYGPSVTTIGNLGSGTIAAFRVTGATVGATAGIHCGGIGSRIFGVDFGHCTTGCVALDSANAGAGKYYLDGLTSVDGGNVGGASPNESFVLRVTGIKQEDGLTVFVGTVAAVTAVADRDIVSDGGVRGRFSDLISQNLAIRGIHIYGPAPLPGDAFNDSVRGPTTLIETHNTSFYGGGPFPPFRVVNFIGYPNGPGTAPVGLLAIADTIANCKAVAGVSLNYVWVAGDLWSCAQAGPVKIEFVAGQLGALTGGEMAYLSELGGADSGKARVGPPPTGVVVPLGPIQSHSDNALTINTALVNLIGFGPAFVARDGHAAESVVANPTAAVGSAADVAVSTDSVVGRIGSGHVVGNIPMTAAGRAMAGAASATAQTALLDPVTSGAKGLAPASGGGSTNFLRADGTWAAPPGAGTGITALTGDVAATGPGSAAATVQPNAVDNTKAADMAAHTFKANRTGSTTDPQDITATQATAELDVFTSAAKGLAPASGGGTSAFLRADGTWATPAGTGGGGPLTGLSGDVTTSGGGVAPATISNDAVTFAKQQNIPTDSLVGRDTAGTGDPESIGVTGGIEFDGSGNIRRSALTGDVSASVGSAGTAINPNVVLDTMLADVPTGTLKGRIAAGTGDPSNLTFAAVKSALAIAFADISGTLQAAQFPALTGDVTTVAGALATTLATTGVGAGTYGDGSHTVQLTIDAKGRITAASAPSISITAGAVAGLTLATGGGVTIDYTFSTSTADSDPGAGALRLNSATQNAASTIFLDLLDATGVDWTSVLDHFSDSPAAKKGMVRLVSKLDPTKWIVGWMTSYAVLSGYRHIDITVVGSSAANPFANGDRIFLCFNPFTPDFIDVGTLAALPALTTLANPTGSSAHPVAATVAQMRTMLGLDVPQSLDLWFSFGATDGNNADSVLPSSGVGNWQFFMTPAMKTPDASHAYVGVAVDANLDIFKVWQFPVSGTWGHCQIEVCATFMSLASLGGATVTAIVTKNALKDTSPSGVNFFTVGNAASSVVAYSFAPGDNVGVIIVPNNSVGTAGLAHAKFTVHVRLTP